MTDLIASTTSITPTVSDVAAQTNTSTASEITGDFETFLQLLTAQMRNQDPTNPIDNTEFVAQLASFSAVEQQVATNEKLQSLIDTIAGSELAGLSNWIGVDVLSDAAAAFDGEASIEISVSPQDGADTAYVSVRDADNAEIQRLAIDPATQNLIWDGQTDEGEVADPGNYTFRHISLSEGVPLADLPAQTFSAVTEARSVNGAIELRFADGTTMTSTQASQMRAIAPET